MTWPYETPSAERPVNRRPRPNDHLWRSRQECAELVGMSVRQLDATIRPHLPECAIDKYGRNVDLYLPNVVKVWMALKQGTLPR